MYRHEELRCLGLVKKRMSISGILLLRQMLLENIIKKDIEEYGVLKDHKKGEAFLKKPVSFKIALNNIFEEAMADDDEEGNAGISGRRCRRNTY